MPASAPSSSEAATSAARLRPWLPLALVLAWLLASLAVPLWLRMQRAQLQRELVGLIGPAQETLALLMLAVAREASAVKSHELVGAGALTAQVQNQAHQADETLRRLEQQVVHLGPSAQSALVQVQRAYTAARQNNDDIMRGSGRVAYSSEVEGKREAAEVALGRRLFDLEEVLAREAATRDREIVRWERWGLIANVVLVMLGLSTVLAVWLLTLRERRARAEAEAALALRDKVLRVVSHDLKNPLHTIGMAAQLMLDAPELGDEMRVKQLAIIRRTGERANRLVIDLLDAARLQAGKGIHVDPIPTSVNSILGEVVESFRAQAETKQQDLECHAPTERLRVVADRDRILQVLANMVGNAVKFTPNGGRIVVRADALNGTAVKFSVADTGPGIPADNLAHLFDPFWQARETASLGSGLGLGIAKGIVEAHGSRLDVESRVGEGTMFSFTLPLADHDT